MANEEVNKSYKEYSINFLIYKIDTEKKKLAILYQDLYKLKEDHQRYLQILTNEKNMMQAIFINTPAINQCDQLERELTDKLHEIIEAEMEGKQKVIGNHGKYGKLQKVTGNHWKLRKIT